VSFGEDARGNLYIAYLVTGDVYRIDTNVTVAGDYDGDGDADFADYSTWRGTFAAATQPVFPPADGNRNGTVDAADYVIWRKAISAAAAAGAGSNSRVPEPATASLLIVFSAALVLIHRRAAASV
jgi:hypothetical protein